MPPSITFHGAAGTVTGSRFEITAAGHHILVDCGLFQGLKELRLQNWRKPPFDARRIEAVLLTHAHIDHSGYLPRLMRDGFRGPIVCTPATAELAEILLLDAAKLQEEDAEYANRKGFSKHKPALPLFDETDARAAIAKFERVPYNRWIGMGPMRARYHQAGHILGSAFIELDLPAGDGRATVVFSGDLGRVDQPLHVDPAPLPACDALVMESTYGDREHDARPLAKQIAEPFKRVIQRGGTILIPAFAVARAQLITLLLRKLIEDGVLPEVPIHIDSPMAVDVTEIYDRHLGSAQLDPPPAGHVELFPRNVRFHRSVAESKQLNNLRGPRIIVSASGMLTGGRVLHHLERLMGDKKNMIVLIGYQAEGTRGRALAQGAPTVRMHGRDVPVAAEVLEVEGLSAHAGRRDLLEWVDTGGRPGQVFLVHGEPGSLEAMQAAMKHRGIPAAAPAQGDTWNFDPATRTWSLLEPPPKPTPQA